MSDIIITNDNEYEFVNSCIDYAETQEEINTYFELLDEYDKNNDT